jgi:hypothetical protein
MTQTTPDFDWFTALFMETPVQYVQNLIDSIAYRTDVPFKFQIITRTKIVAQDLYTAADDWDPAAWEERDR